MEYRRANTYKAVFLFFFSRDRYIAAAMGHGIALNLEAPDQRARYEEGTYPAADWRKNAEMDAITAANQVSASIWKSLILLVFIAAITILLGCFLGSIDPSLSLSAAKVFSFIGAFLASWATLMALGGGYPTWGGEALHELIHPAIFKILFVPGVFLMLVGNVS